MPGMNAISPLAPAPDLLQLYRNLDPDAKLVLRLKALVGLETTKNSFVNCLIATNQRMADGKAWSYQSAKPVIDRLVKRGLLTRDALCPKPLLHTVAMDAAAAPEADWLIEAVRRTFPSRFSVQRGIKIVQPPIAFRRGLRLAIYANDPTDFAACQEMLERLYPAERAVDDMAEDFAELTLERDWLDSRARPLQRVLFDAKLTALLAGGIVAPDLAALTAHERAQADAAGHTLLQDYDLLAGRLAEVRRAAAAADQPRGTLLQASLAFLEGRNDAAVALYRAALKLYRKQSSRRRAVLPEPHGVLFLLALLNTHDAALHAEVRTAIDTAMGVPLRQPIGFAAVQALLWLAQGLEEPARGLLARLRKTMPRDPLSASLVVLAEYALGAPAAQTELTDRFAALRDSLPAVARIHAEILARTAPAPAPFQAWLTAQRGDVGLVFTRIVEHRAPWERALQGLDAFLGSAGIADKPVKAKRLAWFVDPDSLEVEVVEQSAKASGWTDGRAIALKRLHDRDPRLDYLTDHDRTVVGAIRAESAGYYDEVEYYIDSGRALLALVGHPTVFDARQRAQPLELVAYPLELVVSERDGGYHVALSHTARSASVFLEAETPSRYRVVEFPESMLALQAILGPQGVTIPHSARDQLVAMIRRDNPKLPIRADIAGLEAPGIPGQIAPVVQLVRGESGLKVSLVVRPFGAEGPAYVAGLGGRSVLATIAGAQTRATRDLAGELAQRSALIAACPTLRERGGPDMHELALDGMEDCLELLLELQASPVPVTLEWPQGTRLAVSRLDPGRMQIRVAQNRGWFDVDGAATLDDDQVLEMRTLLDRLERRHGRFVQLEDGRFIALTRQLQSQLQQLAAVSEPHRGGRRVHALGAPALQSVLDDAGEVQADAAWQRHVKRIGAAERWTPTIPDTLQAELRDYQAEGFVWMARLARWGAGACLADDMGLGKTVQAIAMLLHMATDGPSLVVAPTSVVANWETEIRRFAPTLTPHRLAGAADRAALIEGLGPRDVLLASYGLLHQESEALGARRWQMAVLDEAQAIKNAQTKRAQATQALQAEFRLALTGTPVENYLDELWSLFGFVNPGLLGSRDGFQTRFAGPIERDRDPHARQALRALLRPFLLRRTKAAVLSELPPRTEQTMQIEMGEAERAFYEALRRRALDTIAALDVVPGKRKLHILTEITRLRRACCNPALIDAAAGVPSGKLEAFMSLVDELIRNRHRALVFSQFTGHLALVRAALDAQGIGYEYLDGSTPAAERERRVATFQAGGASLFLISLRAGGTGLNLTAADYVVHLDPWWNPAVEDQASDRAHRIGQQRPVTIYRLIMQDSIEERILRLHADKRDLAADLLDGAETTARLSEDELLDLIRA
jgi:superfamily II DNA or RNA helicase